MAIARPACPVHLLGAFGGGAGGAGAGAAASSGVDSWGNKFEYNWERLAAASGAGSGATASAGVTTSPDSGVSVRISAISEAFRLTAPNDPVSNCTCSASRSRTVPVSTSPFLNTMLSCARAEAVAMDAIRRWRETRFISAFMGWFLLSVGKLSVWFWRVNSAGTKKHPVFGGFFQKSSIWASPMK